MSEPNSIESETPAAVAGAAPCSAGATEYATNPFQIILENVLKDNETPRSAAAYLQWETLEEAHNFAMELEREIIQFKRAAAQPNAPDERRPE